MSSTAPPKKPVVVEEDFDDLDDVLEQFSTPPVPKPTSATPSKFKSPSAPAPLTNSTNAQTTKPQDAKSQPQLGLDDLNLSDDFASELAKGMAELMREIAAESGPGAEGGDGSEEDKEGEAKFRKAWEEMLVGELNGMPGVDDLLAGGPSGGTGAKGKAKEGAKTQGAAKSAADAGSDNFQDSIRKAMEKLKESESNHQAESASSSEDPLEALLSSLGEGGGQSEDELQGILESMMTQLMSKEVLYEPLKELQDKFPTYLRDNADTIKPEDRKRYDSQQVIITQIISIFESPDYSDEDATQGVKVVGLMNEMQSLGSPPAEIMGPLPPGLDVGTDGLPKLPDGCSVM
ncbi:Peroxisome chaperone and import receptor [Steccherinum ochraceum]|uniref:Peroxisome chaperone and import receptor n=1 Tax=Steccherinum ochraceum TaxID=92696 RepID=A0A4V2MW57_9APHY|nr:Peroxisome chaperone and import receptor [Steccherinum ochraceum]